MKKTVINIAERLAGAFRVAKGAKNKPIVAAHEADVGARKKRLDDAQEAVAQHEAEVEQTRESVRGSHAALKEACSCAYETVKVHVPAELPVSTVSDDPSLAGVLELGDKLVEILKPHKDKEWATNAFTVLEDALSKAVKDAEAIQKAKDLLGAAYVERDEAERLARELLGPFAVTVRVAYGANSPEYRAVRPPRKRKNKPGDEAEGDATEGATKEGKDAATEAKSTEAKEGDTTKADPQTGIASAAAANDTEPKAECQPPAVPEAA